MQVKEMRAYYQSNVSSKDYSLMNMQQSSAAAGR